MKQVLILYVPLIEIGRSPNHDVGVANTSFGNVARFKHLETTVTNQNVINEEIKSRLNSGNAYCHAVHTFLPSRMLSKNAKTNISHVAMLPAILYGYETSSLTLREECILRILENRVLRRIFGHKRGEVT
jgi:hypothetical protein